MRIKAFIYPAIIILAVFGVYSTTFSVPFYYDDIHTIVDNINIRVINLWPPSGPRHMGSISFALNYYFGGLEVFGYHLVNTIIHVINGLLVYWLVLLIFRTPRMAGDVAASCFSRLMAFAVALVFVVHPIETQAVTYITQRFASLATLFYLLSLTCYIRFRLSEGGGLKRYLLYCAALLSAVAAMYTKEISFTLPLVVLLCEFFFFRDKWNKKRILALLPILLTLVIVPLTVLDVGRPAGEILSGVVSLGERTEEIQRGVYLLTEIAVLVTYLRLLILPIGQNLDHDYTLYDSFFTPGVLLSFLFLIAIAGLGVYLFMRSRKRGDPLALVASFGILWFFITLSVESSLIPLQDVLVEHRLYLASIGAFMAFFAGVFYLTQRINLSRRGVYILIAVLTVPLMVSTIMRNNLWADELKFWSSIVRESPERERAWNNLGMVYQRDGNIIEARDKYIKAVEINPDYYIAHTNLGVVYFDMGRTKEAIYHFREAIRISPDFATPYRNLGILYKSTGALTSAVVYFEEYSAMVPFDASAYNDLGLLYGKMDNADKAVYYFNEALKLDPFYAAPYYNLALLYQDKGDRDNAVKNLEIYMGIRPSDVEARLILKELRGEGVGGVK